MKIGMKIEGLDELARTLAQLPEETGAKTMRYAIRKAAEPIRSEAETLMHRGADAPHAADHVNAQVGKSGFSVAIGPARDFHYWLFQEYGTVRHGAKPAMRPAFDRHSATAVDILNDELWWALRRGIPGKNEF